MKKNESEKNRIIDEYYGETGQWNDKPIGSDAESEFSKKLDSAMTYMNNYELDKINMDFDIDSIINAAEAIKQKQKQRKDILVFASIGIALLILMLLIAFKLSVRAILYFQIFIWSNLPLLILPFKLKSGKGGSIA